ncbi:phasin family protein [Melghirimyces algeriensis]|uniref:Polyhydroxyalkanoate synthesis regulator phasin n=1 Tax=Melghirimyces algeriensis TaxID=910412 RepID=A0A521CJ49_9BACL|nr:polyhydroxyalkanoate synthesis regulator [Melghirimyces algeriensis]SMO59483.1 Polyhydroxyalkanoate synthesis regulator phasin [Melghirimyces algeriensis]
MKDLVKKGLAAGLGLAIISKEQTEKTVKDLVNRGELTPSAGRELLDKLIARGEQEQEHLDQLLRKRMKTILNEMEIATKEDIQKMEQQIQILKDQLNTSANDESEPS